MTTATDLEDSLTTDDPVLLTPGERAIAGAAFDRGFSIIMAYGDENLTGAAWNRGFRAGMEAGEHCIENGGPDHDDVNPFNGERIYATRRVSA